jgi:hypothetical protein
VTQRGFFPACSFQRGSHGVTVCHPLVIPLAFLLAAAAAAVLVGVVVVNGNCDELKETSRPAHEAGTPSHNEIFGRVDRVSANRSRRAF